MRDAFRFAARARGRGAPLAAEEKKRKEFERKS
jgi:hypothetical protein